MEVGFTQPPTHSFILGSTHARRAPLSLLPLANLFRMMELQGIRRISLAPFLDTLWGRCKDIQCCFCFTLASVLAKSYIRHANFYYDLLLAPIGPCWHWIAFGLLLALKNRTAFQFGHRAPKMEQRSNLDAESKTEQRSWPCWPLLNTYVSQASASSHYLLNTSISE